jgi:hypothetical protein
MKAGTFVKITKTKPAPDAKLPSAGWNEFTPGEGVAVQGLSLPVDYEIEGILLADVEVGGSVYVARAVPSGAIRLFSSTPVVSVTQNGFATANSIYRVEVIGGEPGEFAPFAEELLRELRPREISGL